MILHCSEIYACWLLPAAFLAIIILLRFNLISPALSIWLNYKHRITDATTGKPIPTAPYKFPDGQGDKEKFLNGRENSLEWEKRYGPLYRIWSGRNPEVVLTRPEHVQQVFRDSDKHLKATNNNSGYFMSQLLGSCVGLLSGTEWKRTRASCEAAFRRPAAETYLALMKRHTTAHFAALREASASASGAVLDPAGDLKYLPFGIVADIIYGAVTPKMMQQLHELATLREELFKYVVAGGLPRFAWSRFLPTRANRELYAFRTAWSSFNRRAWERSGAGKPGTEPTVLGQMYHALERGEVSEEQLLQTLDEILFANLDVTLGGISWNLVFLAAHPEAESRLRAEIFSYSSSRSDKKDFEDFAASSYLLDPNTYLAACISEASRLRPLAAFSVPQAIPTGRTIGGYYFPPNTNFIVDSHAVNQRNAFWGEDTHSFRPERFFEHKAVEARYNFWRFGFGPRQCMGKYVADLIIRVLLVHIVRNFELGMMGAEGAWARDEEVWILHPKMRLRCTALNESDNS